MAEQDELPYNGIGVEYQNKVSFIDTIEHCADDETELIRLYRGLLQCETMADVYMLCGLPQLIIEKPESKRTPYAPQFDIQATVDMLLENCHNPASFVSEVPVRPTEYEAELNVERAAQPKVSKELAFVSTLHGDNPQKSGTEYCKRCASIGREAWKPRSEFRERKNRTNGRQPYCYLCEADLKRIQRTTAKVA